MRAQIAAPLLAALLGWTLLGCGGAPSTASEGPYPVHFRREARAGFRWHTVATSSERVTQSVATGNQPVSSTTEETAFFLEADAEIVSAEGGHPTRIRYVTSRFERTASGASTALVRAGAVIEVVPAGTLETSQVTVDGAPATDELRGHLADVISVTSGNRAEDSFGTDVPRAVGESWYPDLNAISASMASESSLSMAPERSSCMVTVRAREQREGMLGLLVEGTLASSGIEMSSLPPGSTLRESTMAARFGAFLPDDVTSPPLEDELAMEMHVVMDVTTPAGIATVTMDALNVRRRTNRPL